MGDRGKPRVCYILPSYDPDTGSHFFHLYEFLELAAKELDLLVIVEKASASISHDRTELMHHGSSASWYHQQFSWPPFRFLELLVVLLRARARGCRYFYTHYSFYGAMASGLVTRMLGGRAYYWNSGEPWKYERPWLEETVFRFILRHTILVTDPPGLAEEYRKRYGLRPDRIRIVPHHIDVRRFKVLGDRGQVRHKLGIAPEAKVVLFVHRLSRRKGAHLIPEIIAEVIRLHSGFAGTSADSAKREKNVMFVIVGTGPESERLKSEIRNQKLEHCVRLVGEIPQRDIVPYFRAADVLLLPSEEEGFPHVLLEAMAAGIPYVASGVGGVRELTPPELREYIVPSNNTRLFAEKIIEFLSKPSVELARIADAEREWVKQYDIHAVLPKFTTLVK